MPRSFEITVAPAKADTLLERLGRVDGVVGLSLQRGSGIQPPGDIVCVQTTNDGARAVMRVMEELDVVRGGSIATASPRALISPPHQAQLDRETNETIWDEMGSMLRQDTNLMANYLALMALAGAIAAAGLWTDTLHIVIGAMVIAPAFEPLVRMPFGLLTAQSELARSGLASTAAGYGSLVTGGLVAVLLLRILDPSGATELALRPWVQFWTTITATGVLTSTLAATAGALVVSSQRSVLSTGVMIALALVPSIAIVGMGLGVGDAALASRGLARGAVDMLLVIGMSVIVFGVKRLYLTRHPALG